MTEDEILEDEEDIGIALAALRAKLLADHPTLILDNEQEVATRLIKHMKPYMHKPFATRPELMEPVPFNTRETFDGYPLRKLMVPSFRPKLTFSSVNALYSTWITGTKKDIAGVAKLLKIKIPKALGPYLHNIKPKGEHAVRLLWVLYMNMIEDVDVILGPGNFSLTQNGTTIGIVNGVVHTKFGQFDFQVDPLPILNTPVCQYVRDNTLTRLYKQAVDSGDRNLQHTITCFVYAKHEIDWSLRTKKNPYKSTVQDRAFKAIKLAKNPYLGLCKVLVHDFVEMSEFSARFGNPKTEARGWINMDLHRRRLQEKLEEFFEEEAWILNVYG